MKSTVKNGHVTIDFLLEKGRLSSTKKSLIRYSTRGYVPLDEAPGLRVSINVIEENHKDEEKADTEKGGPKLD